MKTLHTILILLAAMPMMAKATVLINIFADRLTGIDGITPIPSGTLVQMVNLGADGVFNPIMPDVNHSQYGQWVSGDDTLVNYAFGNSDALTFPTAAAFDLADGADTAGQLFRTFTFDIAVLPSSTKLGIRWFPGLMASDFTSIILVGNQPYGEFTRQSGVVNSGDLWVSPNDGGSSNFDALFTISAGGSESDRLGQADNIGCLSCPEPSVVILALMGAIPISRMRFRQLARRENAY